MKWIVSSAQSFRVTGGVLFSMVVTLSLASCKPTAPATDPTGNGGAAAPAGAGSTTADQGPLGTPFVGWTDPAAVFVLSGQRHGYLEPCGCSERQSGGMARLADLLRQVKEDKGWPVCALDVGGSLLEERVGRTQSQIKFDALLKGLDTLGFQALNLGLEEMMLGPEKLYTADQTLAGAVGDTRATALLAANVMILSDDLGTPLKSRLLDVGAVKVGVTGIVGATTRQKLASTGLLAEADFVRVDDPEQSLPPVIAELKSQNPELLVLLSHGDLDEARALAAKFPEFHLVVTAGGAEDPPREPEMIGQTMMVQVGMKGKSAAVVGYFPQAEKKLKLELLELDRGRFQNHPSMIEMMRDYQQQLDSRYAEVIQDVTISDKAARFTGVDQCKDCHTYAYSVWEKSKHAHALESLSKGRVGQEANWVSRHRDPECLTCHTTGWDMQQALRFESGFADLQSTPHLAGNQCENCHGPGSEHVKLENAYKADGKLTAELLASRKALDLDLSIAKEKVCTRCHDHENSPNFVFEERWPKVIHTGKKD